MLSMQGEFILVCLSPYIMTRAGIQITPGSDFIKFRDDSFFHTRTCRVMGAK